MKLRDAVDGGEQHEVVNPNGFVTAEDVARHALRLAIAAEDALESDLRIDWFDLLRGAEVWGHLAVMLSVVGPTSVTWRDPALISKASQGSDDAQPSRR